MNKTQRNKNRAQATRLSVLAHQQRRQAHTCENCGEKGGHWISTRGISLAALVAGQDDQEGFWTCPKLYDDSRQRIAT